MRPRETGADHGTWRKAMTRTNGLDVGSPVGSIGKMLPVRGLRCEDWTWQLRTIQERGFSSIIRLVGRKPPRVPYSIVPVARLRTYLATLGEPIVSSIRVCWQA